jgi:CRISPR/Cas system Type II protein with McrA/HNH and RuvC-like nuclease domain
LFFYKKNTIFAKILLMGVLVLNFDYTPLNVTTFRRGFVLVDKGKAEIVKSDESPITAGYKTYVRPLIIRLLNYIKYHTRTLRANRNRIYKRDNYECVYCGSHRNLTLDHVIPKSRGGKNDWTNLVTSCFKCNLKKADKTPEEARMKMKHKPFAPTLVGESVTIQKVWSEFQQTFIY